MVKNTAKGTNVATEFDKFKDILFDEKIITVTYPEFFWADRLHLGVPPPPFQHHGWWKFLNFVPPDALKMHSLAVPVLRFLCKTFSKLRKLNNETLFSMDV